MNDTETLNFLVEKYRSLKTEIGKVIVGQDKAVDSLLLSIFTGGHCLLVGVPGLAKTLMVNTLSKALGLEFSRIQFTPDLMPSDIFSLLYKSVTSAITRSVLYSGGSTCTFMST